MSLCLNTEISSFVFSSDGTHDAQRLGLRLLGLQVQQAIVSALMMQACKRHVHLHAEVVCMLITISRNSGVKSRDTDLPRS